MNDNNEEETKLPPQQHAGSKMKSSGEDEYDMADSKLPAEKKKDIISCTTLQPSSSVDLDTSRKYSPQNTISGENTQQKPTAKKPSKHHGKSGYALRPAPYFYYRNHSQDVNNDLAPLVPALTVPNFVIKLHAILMNDSFSGIIEWVPHGRSFMILNKVGKNSWLPVCSQPFSGISNAAYATVFLFLSHSFSLFVLALHLM